MTPASLPPDAARATIDQLIGSGDVTAARAALGELWQRDRRTATAGFVVSRFERIAGQLDLAPLRLAIERSFTVEPFVPVLRAEAFSYGIDVTVHVGAFGTYVQDVLDETSPLYEFAPDAVLLAVDARDVAPDLWYEFDPDPAVVQQRVGRVAGDFGALVDTLRRRSSAQVVIQGLELPAVPPGGILDAQLQVGQQEAFRQVNRALGDLARRHPNVYVLDYDGLVRRHGALTWHDPHRWSTARLPVAAAHVVTVGREWARFVPPLAGRVCKVLAVDLDNTLWGGVLGEDGVAGLAVGETGAGLPYLELQRAVLELAGRGVLLAVCSKNDEADAVAALESREGMLLRRDHFAAIRINWNDKARNLREIARALNVGIDSVAFLDDNAVERAWVRTQLPEVTVIELPDDPAAYARTLRECPVFERLAITDEDRRRRELYEQERLRSSLAESALSLEDFYRSLEMAVEIELVTETTLPRAAQLTQKTNQFNLTTRRYTEQQLQDLIGEGALAYTLRASDRFGDSGIVGVAIAVPADTQWEIDTLLLSCRVIGRTIETAFVAAIAEDARRAGAERVTGSFRPTDKNAPARAFYREHGFACTADEDEESRWELDLERSAVAWPAWIKRLQASAS